MSSDLTAHALLMLVGVFVSSVAQVLLKRASQRGYDSVVAEYLNAPVVAAHATLLGATLPSVLAYRAVPLSMGAILEATGYVCVTAFGVALFGTRLTRRKVLALALILSGIVVYALLG